MKAIETHYKGYRFRSRLEKRRLAIRLAEFTKDVWVSR